MAAHQRRRSPSNATLSTPARLADLRVHRAQRGPVVDRRVRPGRAAVPSLVRPRPDAGGGGAEPDRLPVRLGRGPGVRRPRDRAACRPGGGVLDRRCRLRGRAAHTAAHAADAAGRRRDTKAGLGSIKEGLRYVGRQRAIQGAFLIDINAMVFGMPRALFPQLGTELYRGRRGHRRPAVCRAGGGRVHRRGHHGWVAHVRRHGEPCSWAVAGVGRRHRAVRAGDLVAARPVPARGRRRGRRDLRGLPRHDPPAPGAGPPSRAIAGAQHRRRHRRAARRRRRSGRGRGRVERRRSPSSRAASPAWPVSLVLARLHPGTRRVARHHPKRRIHWIDPPIDDDIRVARAVTRPGRGPRRARASRSRSPSNPSPSPTPWRAATCAARPRPARARRWRSACRCSSARRRPSRAGPTALVLVPDPRAGRPGAAKCSSRSARSAGRARSPSCTAAQSLEKQARQLDDGVEIVVATPGRLIDLLDRKAVFARTP